MVKDEFYGKRTHIFILAILFTAGAVHTARAQDTYSEIPEAVQLGIFGQVVEDIDKYISELPGSSFREKKKAPNMKKTLSNKYNALNRLYIETLYGEAKDKIIHDVLPKMDGCVTLDGSSGGIPGFDSNDWITDCDAQFYMKDLNRILISHLDHEFLFPYAEDTDECVPAETVNDSVLIGTYNTQNLPDGPSDAIYSGCCEHISDRTQKLADRIIASGYDVIALNETFREEIQNELEALLREEYPFYVKFVDPFAITGLSDSGLMLFSRFPLLRLLDSRMRGTLDEVKAYADHNGDRIWHRWGDVAVTGFLWPYCSDDDCLAAKGAAMVRVQDPDSCRVYNIVFTHLQAWDYPATRTLQLDLIEDLIRNTVPPSALEEEELIILGDLNVNGDYDLTSDREERGEWENKFGTTSAGPFSALGMAHDAWEYETQAAVVPLEKRDRGLTYWYEPPKERLDYILRNDPDQSDDYRLCNQHMTIAYNLRHGASHDDPGMGEDGIDLTDHYGVNVDLNRWAPYCSSQEAQVIEGSAYDPRVNTAEFDGVITYPGSMQWYRIDEGGTYSVTILEEGFDYRIYQSSNMSVPYQSGGYLGETAPFQYVVPGGVLPPPPTGGPPIPQPDTFHDAEGRTYGVVEPPFYIRVFAVDAEGNPDHVRAGNYTLLVHKHAGLTKEDAVILFPNLLGDQNEWSRVDDLAIRWFRIDPDTPDSGRAQSLRFYLEPEDGNPYGLRLLSSSGAELAMNAGLGPLQIDRSDISDNGSTLYLQVQPLNESPLTQYRLGWATNLTVLHTWHNHRLRIGCNSQTSDDWPDAFGVDDDNVTLLMEVYSTISSGGVIPDHTIIRATPVSPLILAHEFDSGQVELIDHLVRAVAYLPDERVSLKLFEDDIEGREHPTAEEVMGASDSDILSAAIYPWALSALPSSLAEFETTFKPEQQGSRVLEIGHGEGVGSEGDYSFYYSFSHGLQWSGER